MNSSVTPQPFYQIAPRPRIGALSVEVVSYILLGLGGLLPVVLLLGVALFLRCYRRHRNAQLDRWKAHLGQDRSLANGGRISEARRAKVPSDLEHLSFSLQDSDLSIEPYFLGLNHAADLDDTGHLPADLKRSVSNSNVYFKDSNARNSRAEVDSAIADCLTDYQSSASSNTGYLLQQTISHKPSVDSSQRPSELRTPEEAGRTRANGYPPGVIMGVNRLMENAKNSAGRTNERLNQSNDLVSGINPGAGTATARKRAPSPPLMKPEPIYSTSTDRETQELVDVQRQDLRADEEQALRYFDDIHSVLSFDLDNLSQDQRAYSFRRNSNVYTTKL